MDVLDKVKPSLEELHAAWDEMGLSSQEVAERSEEISLRLCSVLNYLIGPQLQAKNTMKQEVEDKEIQWKALSHMLECKPPEQPNAPKTSLIQRRAKLSLEIHKLERIKEERVDRGRLLWEEMESLCTLLDEEKYCGCQSGEESVPSVKHLAAIALFVARLKQLKASRVDIFSNLREKLRSLAATLGLEPTNPFEKDVLGESDIERSALSPEYLESMKGLTVEYEQIEFDRMEERCVLYEQVQALWVRLSVSQEERDLVSEALPQSDLDAISSLKKELAGLTAMKLANMQQYTVECTAELAQWWDTICMAQAEREKFLNLNQAGDDEVASLNRLEDELSRVKAYHKKWSMVFELIEKRKRLWATMTTLDGNMNAPSRLNNRGGALLREEKARMRVTRQLPKIESEIEDAVSVHTEDEQGGGFMLYGVPYKDYLRDEGQRYQESKKVLKTVKVQAGRPNPSSAVQPSRAKVFGSLSTLKKKNTFGSMGAGLNRCSKSNQPAVTRVQSKTVKFVDGGASQQIVRKAIRKSVLNASSRQQGRVVKAKSGRKAVKGDAERRANRRRTLKSVRRSIMIKCGKTQQAKQIASAVPHAAFLMRSPLADRNINTTFAAPSDRPTVTREPKRPTRRRLDAEFDIRTSNGGSENHGGSSPHPVPVSSSNTNPVLERFGSML